MMMSNAPMIKIGTFVYRKSKFLMYIYIAQQYNIFISKL